MEQWRKWQYGMVWQSIHIDEVYESIIIWL